jgi:hypothetical protein
MLDPVRTVYLPNSVRRSNATAMARQNRTTMTTTGIGPIEAVPT